MPSLHSSHPGVVGIACQAVIPAAPVLPTATATATTTTTSHPTSTETPTPAGPALEMPDPAAFETRFYPDGGLYVGDRLSMEVIAPLEADFGADYTVQVATADGNILGEAAFCSLWDWRPPAGHPGMGAGQRGGRGWRARFEHFIYISYLDRNYTGSDFDLVLHHEMVHTLDAQLGGELHPLIFTEGFAVYLTGGHFKPEASMPRAAALLKVYESGK